MNRVKQIQAIFLLNIIAILMFHTAIPHVHHVHETFTDDQHIHLNHNDNHHDHSTHQHFEESDILANLLDEIAHSVHADEYIKSDKVYHDDLILKFDFSSLIQFHIKALVFSPQIEKNNLHRYALYKQGHYFNPFLQSCSLRAPPLLG